MYQSALFKAIRFFGSQTALAKAIGVNQQAISNWLNREDHIPYKQVLRIVAATRGLVSHHELAPEEKILNRIIDDLWKFKDIKIRRVPIEIIKLNKQFCLHDDISFAKSSDLLHELTSHPLLVDADYQLLTCNCQLEFLKMLDRSFVDVKIIHENEG